ncbi:hypothetical protein [uncultured Bdellovibrio sp.]|uniref:hypothetical protein n=1 Tax=Bdellovibrio sp. HCB-162 TaxID=3394234 RepID=UPI0025E5E691|nr:hypothetical protein [uncultured Bdellovibrio sp.]
MKAQKKSVTSWDDSFFKDFVALRNRLYASHPDFVSEDLSDLELFFGKNSYFANKMDWTAVLLGSSGRYLLSMSPAADSLYLGYFECDNDEEALHQSLLQDIAVYKQKYPQLKTVIGPIQGSLFAGYRFREQTEAPRFLGESLHRDSYPELWKKWGFQIGEYWDSYSFEPHYGYSFYKSIEQKFEKFWKDPKIVSRPLDLNNWDHEIQDVYDITMEAYNLTNTNDEIDFKIFKNISEKMKPLLKPRHVKMLEYDGKTVAFTICYSDIQEEIRRFNKRKSFLPAWLNNLVLFAGIQFKKHPLLLVYVAKRKECPIKWAMAKLGTSMITGVNPDDYPLVISALNAESSGSRASLPDRKALHSRHFLMTLSLS